MLGPTLSERVAVAADRERVLARANAVARDLHDRLGHTLTAMTVQATAARRLLPTDPQATERGLAAIEALGRRAQADVDGVVRALRDGAADGIPVSGAPAAVDLVDIARTLVNESTLDVDLRVPEGLPVDHGRAETVRAVIREALTNATRHGTGSATLRLHSDEQCVYVDIRNPIRHAGSTTPQRAGLAGLHESVLLADGQITAGPEGGGSWLLTARLPINRPAPTPVIRIVVVDDDDLVRSGLAAILDLEPDMEVVGQGADGVDVPALVARSRPEVMLMDVRMPRVDGIAATARLSEQTAGPAVVVITTFESDDAVHDALLAGARGFVLKRARPEELLAAVRTVARTDSLVFPEAIRRIATARRTTIKTAWAHRLTARERDVLAQVARGQTNAEVAESLVVSVETVKSHLRSLLAKSGSRHRTELVVRCYEAGVLD